MIGCLPVVAYVYYPTPEGYEAPMWWLFRVVTSVLGLLALPGLAGVVQFAGLTDSLTSFIKYEDGYACCILFIHPPIRPCRQLPASCKG